MTHDEEVAAEVAEAEREFWWFLSSTIAGELHDEIVAVEGVSSGDDLIAAFTRAINTVAKVYGEETGNTVDVDLANGVTFN